MARALISAFSGDARSIESVEEIKKLIYQHRDTTKERYKER